MPVSTRYWLVKSEPECFSIHHLASCPNQTTSWSGVRNYQARNFMRDGMKVGDRLLFYHSSTDPPAVAGTALVVRQAYPDPTALDQRDQHFDPKASPRNPIWVTVDIRLERIFPAPLAIGTLRGVAALRNMVLLRKGSRLSVQPVTAREFEVVTRMAGSKQASPSAGMRKKRAAKKKPHQTVARSKPAKRKRMAGRR